ncbi:MAG: glycosyltransferase, partial [Oscillospiraceae bacterium]|nr:glycosyltransferase [Oscillospiraceae bacterium]
MKILLATMGLDIGGAETHITELAKELIRRGHEVIVASNGGVYEAEITGAGARHFSVPLNRRRPIPMLKSLFRLNRIIKTEKPDVVHAHARIPGFLIGIIRKFRKFPFVTTAHWVFESGGALGFLTNWGEKTVAVSEDIREYLKKNYGVRDEDIFVTINGIDTDKFSPETDGSAVRREFNIPDSSPVISHVSRLDESRALAARVLISSAERIAAMLPGAVLLIAGDGDCFDELSEKSKAVNARLGREAVVMAGARTDVASFVAAGDYFVGVSRAALEAMSAAKPVIVAGNEGYLGIFTPERLAEAVETNFCCRGCPETTGERLVSDLEKLINMPRPELERLGDYGREVIKERYSVGRMTDDNLRAYRAARMPKSIVMSGYFGFDNAGDEAILSSVYSMAKKTLPGARITVLSHSPEKTRATYGCEAVNRFSPIKIHSVLKKSDVLIFGGGSLLQDRTSSRSLFYYSYILNRAYKLGTRVVMLANGIGPVTREAN